MPQEEFWTEIIQAVRSAHPSFLFVAEAYWDLERELQQQGFDFCYDKRLYDRLLHEDAGSLRGHLSGDADYQRRLVRLIENHDEPRSSAAFPPDRLRAAAVVALTAPGARLLYEGQLEGRRSRPPVFLARRATEAADASLMDFYTRLLSAMRRAATGRGTWRMCETEG